MRTYFRNRATAEAESPQPKGLPSPDTPMPFLPELYRLAVEMSAPNGYGWMGKRSTAGPDSYLSFAAAAMSEKRNQTESVETAHSEISEDAVENTYNNAYNKVNTSVEGSRLRFMSHRDQFYKNLENVEPLPGYQDVACHADAYSFAAQDPETEELLQEITVKELAYRIIDSGKYTGGPIRLLACNSGVLEEGIAQQLADLLKVPVLAPTNTVFTSADGYVAVAAKETEAAQAMIEMRKKNMKFSMDGRFIIQEVIKMNFITYREFYDDEDGISIYDYLEKTPYSKQDKIARFLNSGKIEFARLSRVKDIFTGERIPREVLVMSDGEYYWANYLAWYVEKYNLRMPEEFEKYILERMKE